MSSLPVSLPRRWFGSLILVGAVLGTGLLLAAWKHNADRSAAAASAHQPEPVELVTLAKAEARAHRQTNRIEAMSICEPRSCIGRLSS